METSQAHTIDKKEKTGLGSLWTRFRAVFRHTETSLPLSPSRPGSQLPPTAPTVAGRPLIKCACVCFVSGMTDMDRHPRPASVTPSTDWPEGPPLPDQVQGASNTQTTQVEEVETPLQTTDGMASSKTEVDVRLERIHAAFKGYDFVLDEECREMPITLSESRARIPYERVQKSIRMRVKYTCHNCRTVYGHDRICISCQHRRCPACVRHPPKKNKARPKEEPEVAIVAREAEQECACHECQTSFRPGAEKCPNCHHKICPICLKEAMITVANEPPPPNTTVESKTELPQETKPPDASTVTTTAAI